ncbi:hypothetical protein Peur_004133 [Populus x canadensis]|uniref:NADH dehydrogenase [ubiquinone] 1 alpha subcomplex subunit 6 n=1 Tax=Populus nigra TaxID=3691 RepID=UPI002B272625|nr:NADH dehydrogenase [ubiquinone] 1 alpha subcomplex subunit 6 [Populus nigra]
MATATAQALRVMKVAGNSRNVEEARARVFDFFKLACRSLPAVMDIYNLDDVVNKSQLRSAISSQIRKNAHVTNAKVIDMLLFKGMEELGNIVEHHKQRHHIIGQYILGKEGTLHDSSPKDPSTSDFLKNFYSGNYF